MEKERNGGRKRKNSEGEKTKKGRGFRERRRRKNRGFEEDRGGVGRNNGGSMLSYDFPGSFRNGKYAENNSGQERIKSGTLPVTDKDLASTYMLCRPSPTCP